MKEPTKHIESPIGRSEIIEAKTVGEAIETAQRVQNGKIAADNVGSFDYVKGILETLPKTNEKGEILFHFFVNFYDDGDVSATHYWWSDYGNRWNSDIPTELGRGWGPNDRLTFID